MRAFEAMLRAKSSLDNMQKLNHMSKHMLQLAEEMQQNEASHEMDFNNSLSELQVQMNIFGT